MKWDRQPARRFAALFILALSIGGYRISTATQPASSSSSPTDAEIYHCRMFAEPLVPVGGKTTPEENAQLKGAIYAERADWDDHSAIVNFLKQRPNSPWRVALLTNLGLDYRRTGWFLKALEAWQEAWSAGKNETSPMGKALVDRAVGELAELNARLGRRKQF